MGFALLFLHPIIVLPRSHILGVMSGSGNRYVPPHLRGRGNSQESNSHGHSSDGRNASGSRWKNLDNGNNKASDRNNQNRYGGGRDFSNRHSRGRDAPRQTTSIDGGNNKGSTNSRWANVNRSAIESGTYMGGNGPRWSNQARGDHNAARYKQEHQLAHAEAVFFGDSFIKLFGLLNDFSDSLNNPRRIEVQKYKAASAKGLCREGNENRANIVKTVDFIRRQQDLSSETAQKQRSNNHRPAYQHLERLVFCFGSVDVHMSYYYKKFVQDQPLSEDDLTAIANNYVDFVAGLDTGKPLTKIIVGIYPSPLCDKDVGASLLAYGSLETQEQVIAVDASDDRFIESRQARVDLFNRALRDRCDGHNSNGSVHGKLEYWDVREELLTHDDTTGKPVVRDTYKDVSDLNIHLIHETTLQLWVAKWSWYEALTHNDNTKSARHSRQQKAKCNAQLTFLEYLQKTFDEYRKTKPWAERTHVAETQGIRLSL